MGASIFHAEVLSLVVQDTPGREYTRPAGTTPSAPPDAEFVLPVEIGPPVELRLWRRRPLDMSERRLALLLCGHLGLLLRQARSPELGPSASQQFEDLDRLEALTRTLTQTQPHSAALAAVETGTRLLGALGGGVATLRPDGSSLELIASTGYEPAFIERWRHFPLSLDVPLAVAVRSREPVFVADPDPLLTGDAEGRPRSNPPASVALPLLALGRPIGAICFTFDSLEQAERQRAFLGALASTCAHALDRAHHALLYDRLQRLQELSADLVRAVTAHDVAEIVAESALNALAADAAVVARLADDGHSFESLASAGNAAGILDHLRRFPVETATPLAHAARLGETIVCETPEAILERYPALAHEVHELGTVSLVALPLAADGRRVGAIRVAFRSPRVVDEGQLEFMRSLAQLGGQSIDRAQQARQHHRTARLQRLTALLSVARTPDELGSAMVEAGTSLLGASGGAIAEMDEQGVVRLLANTGLPDDFIEQWEERVLDETTLLGQLLPRQPLLVGSPHEAATVDPWLADQLETRGWGALAGVAFRQDGAPRGGLLLVFAEEVNFAPDDEYFLGTIGDLCAQALERAQLHAVVDESRRRLEALLERVEEGVVTVGADLRVEYMNPEAQTLLDSAVNVGRRLPARWGSFPLRAFARDASRAKRSVEKRFSEGESTFEIVGIPGGESTVLVLRDVSDRARAERAEREFVHNAAHEVRTPLAAIGSALEALRLGAKDEAWARDYFIASMATETERLSRLITALLTLAHAQADPEWLAVGPVDVAPVLHEVANSVPAKAGVRVLVRCPDDAQVLAEPTLLGAALANLAENAARHTETGTITLACGEPRDGTRTIVVRDTGSGIDPETRERIFERFSRGDHDGTGHGLGLAIVRAMAAALRGSLSLSSKPENGTEASLTLQTP